MVRMDPAPTTSIEKILITFNALEKVPHQDVLAALRQHGRVPGSESAKENRQEDSFLLQNCCRLLSAHQAANRVKFWIITEADRPLTNVLLPDEF